MADIKIGDIFFSAEGNRGCAYWRSVGDTTNVFLAAIALDAYNGDTRLQNQFLELAAAVAAHQQCAFIASKPRPIELPCAQCTAPQAADVRHRAAQVADLNELELSPSGLPLGCCRVHVIGAFGGQPDTPRPAARRGAGRPR
jgi:hypothetical protein